jgi:hypothetical protein
MVQVAQLSNHFVNIFTTESENEDENTPLNLFNRKISLVVIPPKFTKGHLNASF